MKFSFMRSHLIDTVSVVIAIKYKARYRLPSPVTSCIRYCRNIEGVSTGIEIESIYREISPFRFERSLSIQAWLIQSNRLKELDLSSAENY
jgi:hypothetical protein